MVNLIKHMGIFLPKTELKTQKPKAPSCPEVENFYQIIRSEHA